MIILASKSPRRKELIKLLFDEFKVIEADVDEGFAHLSPAHLSHEIAKMKAYEVFKTHPDDIIIGCDTIVIFGDKAIGKPKDFSDAYRILKTLSGNRHVVISSYTIISKEFEINRSVKSYVYFNELSDQFIEQYIEKFQPFDKAGSYGIQDDERIIKKIQGSYFNVMGFPVEDIRKHLKSYIKVKD